MTVFEVQPIGVVRSGRDAADGRRLGRGRRAASSSTPTSSTVEATDGLLDFSHVEVVFLFDRVDPDAGVPGARHPRGNTDWPSVGILAQRAKDRPNRIGSTVCALDRRRPGWLEVRGPRRHRRHAGARREALPDRVRAPRVRSASRPGPTELMSGYW